MAVDLSVFDRIKTKADYDRENEEFQIRKLQAIRASTGQDPAAVKLANEIQKARASGDVQRLNDLQMSAKLMDRGVIYDQNGNPVAMGGYGNAVGSIEGAKAMYKQEAQNASDYTWRPQIARDVAQQEANVKLATQPNIEAATDAAKIPVDINKQKAEAYQDFLTNKLGPARTKIQQAQQTISGMRGPDGKGLSPDVMAVVGARNPLSGAVPFTQDPDNPTLPRTIAGTPAASGAAKIKQAQGQVFLEAYESLRGAGALTNIEGQKGEQAKARLSAAQDEQAFDAALKDLADVLESSSARLDAKEAEANQFIEGLSNQSDPYADIPRLSMGDLEAPFPAGIDPLLASRMAVEQRNAEGIKNPHGTLPPPPKLDPAKIPMAAVKELRADPSAAAEFDQTFGVGAAALVLGKKK